MAALTTRAQTTTTTTTVGSASRLTRAVRTGGRPRRCARVMTNAAAAAAAANSYLLLTLHYVDGMMEKRGPHREAHLAGAQRGYDDGTIVMAGALLDPVDAGVFVFKNVDEAHVKAFAEADAYYVAGLVPRYTIRPWMVVVGN
jgi:uncharacterized protein